MTERWDVLVVGARCAGASLATTLARRGARVLVLESDAARTGNAMSTHFVQPAGIAALARLGVAERVRAVTPASHRLRLMMEDTAVDLDLHRPAFCVRRSTLDPWLQEAAEQAGAQLRFRHKVVGLVRAGDRVCGVEVESPKGSERIAADMVVGADGTRSAVARLVDAPRYLEETGTRAGYWAYYPSATWRERWDALVLHQGDAMRLAFRTDGDLVTLCTLGPHAGMAAWGREYRERLHADLLGCEAMRPLVDGNEPVGQVMGALRLDYFYRQPCGDGWALIGDAGQHRDVATGQGITDALLDGERLADALCAQARQPALLRFWRERDAATLPIHFDARNLGHIRFNTAFMRCVYDNVQRSPEAKQRFCRMIDRDLPPHELLPMGMLLRWVGRAALRLRFDVVRGFLATGGTQRAQHAEITRAQRALASLPPPDGRTRFAAGGLTQVA